LERGDSVVVTARDASSLGALVSAHGDAVLPIALDVTDRDAVLAVAQAHGHFGRLDVVVNNAGYGQFDMVEELSEAESREQIETNLFGALWVTQAGCLSCAPRAAVTSCRFPPSVGSPRSPASAFTTRPSGRWKV